MKNEVEQIALQNDMSIEFVTWFFNEKKVGCGNVWFMMMAAMWEGWKGRSIEMDKLATENMALKATSDDRRMFIMNGVQLGYIKVPTVETDPALETIRIAVSPQEPTPATDRIVAGIKADGVEEFVSNTVHKIFDESEAVSALAYLSLANSHVKKLREGAK
ncbi:hypothetical protein ACUZK0_003601 [Klebsiella pneumoniae]